MLKFKSSEAAFEYVKEYFSSHKLKKGNSYIGIVRLVDNTATPTTYMVEVACIFGKFFKKQNSTIVAALKHPDLDFDIVNGDLVVFGMDDKINEFETGFILHKLIPELDESLNQFKHYDKKKYRVFVDDNFHFMNEDERYLFDEFTNLEEAVVACQKIVDESLNSLMETTNHSDLLDSYLSFGESPFIEGESFSALEYAKAQIIRLKKNNKKIDHTLDAWRFQIDHTYGLLLKESEIIVHDGFISFCQTDRKKLCASWNIEARVWNVELIINDLHHKEFSTVKKFEDVVFSNEDDFKNYRNKQFLIEFLLNGNARGELKTLSATLDNSARIEFTVDWNTWNNMLIGNWVGIETGMCKYFEDEKSEEKFIPFGMICDNWNINFEIIFGEYNDYIQKEIQLKELGNFYS